MSSPFNVNTSQTDHSSEPPAHHVHGTEDPLPGARGAPVAPDYSTSAVEAPGFEQHANVNVEDPHHGTGGSGVASKVAHELNPTTHVQRHTDGSNSITDNTTSKPTGESHIDHSASGTHTSTQGLDTARAFTQDSSTPQTHPAVPSHPEPIRSDDKTTTGTGSGAVHSQPPSNLPHSGPGYEKDHSTHNPNDPKHDHLDRHQSAAGGAVETTSKPKLADKLVGKAQQAAGKITKNEELVNKGELRATEGKPSQV